MSSLTRPRGPLPPRVYWTRRLLALGLALGLVGGVLVGVGRVLSLSSDGSSAPDQARQAAATPSASGGSSAAERGREQKRTRKRKSAPPTATTPTAPPLAVPTGPCTGSEIIAAPLVTEAAAGAEILITLELRTRYSEACTWTVSPDTLTMKITSGRDDIWSSRECPAAIPVRNVTVRHDVGTKVGIQWTGRRSDATCSDLTEWALPGFYHVVSAALAGEPTDLQFELVKPPRPVVTKTITPSPSPSPSPSPKGTKKTP